MRPVRPRECDGLPSQQRAPCHPEVRECEQRYQVRLVIRQSPVPRRHVAKLPLDDPERVLDLPADRAHGPFRDSLGRPRRQQATLARWHGHHLRHSGRVAPAGDAPTPRAPSSPPVHGCRQPSPSLVDGSAEADGIPQRSWGRCLGYRSASAASTPFARHLGKPSPR